MGKVPLWILPINGKRETIKTSKFGVTPKLYSTKRPAILAKFRTIKLKSAIVIGYLFHILSMHLLVGHTIQTLLVCSNAGVIHCKKYYQKGVICGNRFFTQKFF
jgi:hypothetical protein